MDGPNGYVHVFGVSHVPAASPTRIADIKLRHVGTLGGWLQHSRDGRYVYVGDSGDVIDTKTLTIVGFLPTLLRSRELLEIDWRGDRVVGTTSRTGLGYVAP